jgi:hypothetical protein
VMSHDPEAKRKLIEVIHGSIDLGGKAQSENARKSENQKSSAHGHEYSTSGRIQPLAFWRKILTTIRVVPLERM